MNNSLDFTPERFEELLNKTSDLVLSQHANMEEKKAYHYFPQSEIEAWFDEELPHDGLPPEQVLDLFKEKVMDTATNNLGPYMYAYVMAGGSQMSLLAEKLTATINQNVGKWHLGPAVSEIEKRVVQWAGELTTFGENCGGVMVSGGSAANLAGLTVARNIFFEKYKVREKGLFAMKPFTVYASTEVHGCVDKSMEELGIGTDQLRKIEVNEDFTINTEALKSAIEEDKAAGFTPFCIVGTAGTVNTGAIDDLTELASIAKGHDMWFHIDGAYGGLPACLDSIQKEYKGIELADSLALDFHKWMYQTFEAGCLLVNDFSLLQRTYYKRASYLDTRLEEQGRTNFNEHYFQLTRNAKAVKVWMSLKTYGMQKLRSMIQKDIDLAHYLAEEVEKADDFELKSTSHLAVTCFRFTNGLTDESKIEELNRKLIPALERDGRVFITGTTINKQFVIRACLINHRMHKGTVDYLVKVVREVGNDLV
ncbi:pyridoxal phosphate-dependent decarboxylase family protein [Ekhidna sp. To15]|uniref:pyridoxal phosphate-dependent decarboxylase family protein n=1 Tax=Ekhidna sp. To15 TaxID=3395267 RepID=UPI003F520B7C